jgi:hypothetical protein
MTTDFVRNVAATAAIFGFFASAWFGWAQEDPPAQWRPWLIAGSIMALATALAGGLLTWRLYLRRQIDDGTLEGPRLFVSGPLVMAQRDGHTSTAGS